MIFQHAIEDVQVRKPTPAVSQPKPPPAAPSSPRITILPQKVAHQPSPSPEKEREAKAVTEPETAYILQVASFSTPARAQKFADTLLGKGYPAEVIQSVAEGHSTYAVCVSQLKDKDAAETALNDLKKDYPDAFLKHREGPES